MTDRKCNIILIEDNKMHREGLIQALKEDYGHIVKGFRDFQTFKQACDDRTIVGEEDSGRPLIIILDIMMAEELDDASPFAPRFTGQENGINNQEHYVDDELGLKLAEQIRDVKFQCIPSDTPILFFTARQEPDIISRIENDEMQPALHLEKPAWIEDVQDKIEQLLNLRKAANGGQRKK